MYALCVYMPHVYVCPMCMYAPCVCMPHVYVCLMCMYALCVCPTQTIIIKIPNNTHTTVPRQHIHAPRPADFLKTLVVYAEFLKTLTV